MRLMHMALVDTFVCVASLSQAQEGKDHTDDHDKPNQIDDTVHDTLQMFDERKRSWRGTVPRRAASMPPGRDEHAKNNHLAAQAPFSHFFMKLVFAAPASGLPSALTALVAQASAVHFFMNETPPRSIAAHGGVFPVRRGAADQDAFTTALAVLERGNTMAMYAEGGRSRTGEPAKKAKRGIGRLALQSGAPIVPIAIVGSSHVRNWKRGHFPKIRVYYGEPFAYERVEAPTRGQEQAVADAIFAEVRKLYAASEGSRT